jgi:hypothetical protein
MESFCFESFCMLRFLDKEYGGFRQLLVSGIKQCGCVFAGRDIWHRQMQKQVSG